ncbi:hypothetical protein DPMN_091818 [Dreissena polymorpha]|uniref:Uncharacterized protein n=1 Tax=Dreissena polymorpha TaxID=45954 RepID=A0A9D4R0B0_DREPO|nr:hypothetical protein DPMN_091818 [Dreissena polymorpha]
MIRKTDNKDNKEHKDINTTRMRKFEKKDHERQIHRDKHCSEEKDREYHKRQKVR